MSVGGVGPGASGPVESNPEESWSLDPRGGRAEAPPQPPVDVNAGHYSPSGVMLVPPPGFLLPSYDTQGSFLVTEEGNAALAGLKAAAEKNTTGPEARLASFIREKMNDALASIKADEARARLLPAGSPERKALEDQIDRRVARFRNDIALETLKTADEIRKREGGEKGGFERFKNLLPGYLRECVERKGVVIPGVPGAFKPRTDDGFTKGPTGADYEVKF